MSRARFVAPLNPDVQSKLLVVAEEAHVAAAKTATVMKRVLLTMDTAV